MGPITVKCRNCRANVHIADPTRGGGRYVCGKCQEAVELPEPYGLNSDASTLSDYVGGVLKYPDIDGDAGDGQQGSVNYEPTHCGDCGAEIALEDAQYFQACGRDLHPSGATPIHPKMVWWRWLLIPVMAIAGYFIAQLLAILVGIILPDRGTQLLSSFMTPVYTSA